ncbi:hypothetical protein [Methylovirgula sp. 4M-Z18]|uniref:hypothetical protein n=1 Tax=Methylovirgula sp. 4M-Z18 TaxID=2293567 RepID=UPI000E2FC396|nr:hypothetical protein [Methylovirgula sp. 4M-Z18]
MSDMDEVKDRLSKIEKLLEDIQKQLAGAGAGTSGSQPVVTVPPGTFFVVPRRELRVTSGDSQIHTALSDAEFIVLAPVKRGNDQAGR